MPDTFRLVSVGGSDLDLSELSCASNAAVKNTRQYKSRAIIWSKITEG